MTDRELLELAAKAAGIELLKWVGLGCWSGEKFEEGFQLKDFDRWNPLTDDGDALRLAVKLGMIIEISQDDPSYTSIKTKHDSEFMIVQMHDDPCAATRRAIVRAAAEIGRTMG